VVGWRALGAIFVGGGIGSVLRYVAYALVTARFGPGFPLGTLLVNLTGSFVIGIVFELSQVRAIGISPIARLFFMTGVLGGYTTFSTFSLDGVTLAGEGASAAAVAYALASVLGGFGCAYAGTLLVRLAQS
jgi:CrcB protein